ncbi:MAG: hypothetical protein WCV81_03295 [Microgenomates group bacterium]|jgi:hypothetical protein
MSETEKDFHPNPSVVDLRTDPPTIYEGIEVLIIDGVVKVVSASIPIESSVIRPADRIEGLPIPRSVTLIRNQQ